MKLTHEANVTADVALHNYARYAAEQLQEAQKEANPDIRDALTRQWQARLDEIARARQELQALRLQAAPSERQPEPPKMEICREGNRFWHINCTSARMGGMMKEIHREPDASLFECVRCGSKGRYPVGGAGTVFTDCA